MLRLLKLPGFNNDAMDAVRAHLLHYRQMVQRLDNRRIVTQGSRPSVLPQWNNGEAVVSFKLDRFGCNVGPLLREGHPQKLERYRED